MKINKSTVLIKLPWRVLKAIAGFASTNPDDPRSLHVVGVERIDNDRVGMWASKRTHLGMMHIHVQTPAGWDGFMFPAGIITADLPNTPQADAEVAIHWDQDSNVVTILIPGGGRSCAAIGGKLPRYRDNIKSLMAKGEHGEVKSFVVDVDLLAEFAAAADLIQQRPGVRLVLYGSTCPIKVTLPYDEDFMGFLMPMVLPEADDE